MFHFQSFVCPCCRTSNTRSRFQRRWSRYLLVSFVGMFRTGWVAETQGKLSFFHLKFQLFSISKFSEDSNNHVFVKLNWITVIFIKPDSRLPYTLCNLWGLLKQFFFQFFNLLSDWRWWLQKISPSSFRFYSNNQNTVYSVKLTKNKGKFESYLSYSHLRAREVKVHAFFKGVDWKLVELLKVLSSGGHSFPAR